MSSDKIYLTREEQEFLMEHLSTNNASEAAEKFVIMLVEERVDPNDFKVYLKKIMRKKKENA